MNANFEAKSINRKTYQITKNGHLLGELIYKNFFMSKADIQLATSEIFEINPVGFFGTSITVTKNGNEIVALKMNWKSQIIFTFHDGQKFVLRAKGLFMNQYIIENQEGEILIQFDPQFKWRQFKYNYDITYHQKSEDLFLVLLGVYAVNYLIAAISGAA